MDVHQNSLEELIYRLTFVNEKMGELRKARQRFLEEIANLKEKKHLLSIGAKEWIYEAIEVKTQEIHIGKVLATDMLHASCRAMKQLPPNIGYSITINRLK